MQGGLIPRGPNIPQQLNTITRCWVCRKDYPIEDTSEHLHTAFAPGRICKGCAKKQTDEMIKFLKTKNPIRLKE